jgi:hypothetical protein
MDQLSSALQVGAFVLNPRWWTMFVADILIFGGESQMIDVWLGRP